jgi:uncharacterized protein GlcG (DUF336 family)
MRVVSVVIDAWFTPAAMASMDRWYPNTCKAAVVKTDATAKFPGVTNDLIDRIKPESRAALASIEPNLMYRRCGRPLRDGDRTLGAIGLSSGCENRRCAILIARRSGS